MKKYILNEIEQEILFLLLDSPIRINTSAIVKKLYGKFSYSSICINLYKLEKLNLIITERKNRNRFRHLTEKGIMITNHLKEIQNILKVR